MVSDFAALLKDKADQSIVVEENDPIYSVSLKSSNTPLRLGTKVTLLLIKHYNKDKWIDAPDFTDKDCVPNDNHQLEMALGISLQLCVVAKDVVQPNFLRMGQTKDGWTKPHAKEEGQTAKAHVKPTTMVKRKATDGGDQAKK